MRCPRWIVFSLALSLSACTSDVLVISDSEDQNPGDDNAGFGNEDTDPGQPGDGDNGGEDDTGINPQPEPQSIALAAPAEGAQTIELGQTAEFVATVTSQNFAGDAVLSLTGAAPDWTVEITPSVVTLAKGGSQNVGVKVSVPTNGTVQTGALQLLATSTVGNAQSALSLTVENELTIPIIAGAGNGNHGFSGEISVRAGTMLRFVNLDSSKHRLHFDGVIPHQPNQSAQGESYDVTASAGTATFYCHDHGTGGGVESILISE